MKKNKGKIVSIFITILSIVSICMCSYAHSGRTDSSGGHKDNKNKSGLGSYHYHCGGNPAHLHKNGVCPYSSSKSTSSSSSSSKSSSSKSNSTTNKSTTITATSIEINEEILNMKVGETKTITATITPSNVTNKSITWKTSDGSVAIISSTGKITSKKAGIVTITASTSNGKTDTIKINIKEKEKVEGVEEENIIRTSTIVKNKITNNSMDNNEEESNPLSGILALGIIAGGGYLGYKKYKNTK